MKRFAFAAVAAATLLMAGGVSAREIAYCTPGFNIEEIAGDKAVCVKTEQTWVNKGPRHCLAGGHIINGDEAGDGGDKCTGTGVGSLVSGPAILCEIDPAYGPGYRTRMVRGDRDQCQKQETQKTYGNILTRTE